MNISFFASYLNFSEFIEIGKDSKMCEREVGRGILPSILFPNLFPKLIATPINNIRQKKLA